MARKIIDMLMDELKDRIGEEQVKKNSDRIDMYYILGEKKYKIFKSMVPVMEADGQSPEDIRRIAYYAGFSEGMRLASGEEENESKQE